MPNGNHVGDLNEGGASAVICNTGYEHGGDPTATCWGGVWTVLPTCSPKGMDNIFLKVNQVKNIFILSKSYDMRGNTKDISSVQDAIQTTKKQLQRNSILTRH